MYSWQLSGFVTQTLRRKLYSFGNTGPTCFSVKGECKLYVQSARRQQCRAAVQEVAFREVATDSGREIACKAHKGTHSAVLSNIYLQPVYHWRNTA